MIILDFGSGETCRNDPAYIRRMIDELAAVDPRRRDIVIKWQLFNDIVNLAPLTHESYLYAKDYAASKGYRTASSVFDEESLDFLLSTHPAFVKIAARPHLYHLLKRIPPRVQRIVSVQTYDEYSRMIMSFPHTTVLCCVAQYPAPSTLYESFFHGLLHYGISDHTCDFRLYSKYDPQVWERHYCLDDSTGPDAAEFAIRPRQLKELLHDSATLDR